MMASAELDKGKSTVFVVYKEVKFRESCYDPSTLIKVAEVFGNEEKVLSDISRVTHDSESELLKGYRLDLATGQCIEIEFYLDTKLKLQWRPKAAAPDGQTGGH